MSAVVPYAVDWGVAYPTPCTRQTLLGLLRDMGAQWSGWDKFAWYLTRTLHRQIDGPPLDWDHLHTLFWLRGLSAHVLLTGTFEDRGAVLDLLVRHQVQIVGMLRHIVADQIRWCLIFRKQERLPDCALWGADTQENRETVAKKRAEFVKGMDEAVAEFVRVLNFAAAMEDVNERIAGHPLRTWFKGAHMPEQGEVPVQVLERNGRVVLLPDTKTAGRFLSRRLPVPRIEVNPGTVGPRPVGRPDGTVADGAPDGNNGVDQEKQSREIAFRSFELATRLDTNPRMKPPTHAVVLGLYCVEELSVSKIARKCGCGHGTVINRKKELERKLGLPLESFRQHTSMMEEARKTAEDPRARRIYRKGLAG